MGQVLYRKYRSKDLSEVVGQEHITDSLQHALKSGKIAHAYLFTGPRGVGKTSVARILAYAVNDLPYTDDNNLDIIEIDAASNRRIDEIRDLRDKVNIAPTGAKYKVYIIDEVHMLTREAFNALLKTLEEPPEHVIFILATTEAHKLPETIISRTQRYSFRPVDKEKMVKHLGYIAKKEKIKVDQDALNLIAEHGEGSFRDSISLLDQLSHQDDIISVDTVRIALGIAPAAAIDNILDFIGSSNLKELSISLSSLYGQGYQATTLAKQVAETLRAGLTQPKPKMGDKKSLLLLKELIEVPASNHPEALLEVILFDATISGIPDVQKNVIQPDVVETIQEERVEEETKPKEDAPIEKKKPRKTDQKFDLSVWPEVLTTIKKKHNTLYSFLRMARPEYLDGVLVLHFAFKFHQQRLSEAKNKESIQATIKEITGKDIELNFEFTPGTTPYDNPAAKVETVEDPTPSKETSIEDTINNIFGSSEVLES